MNKFQNLFLLFILFLPPTKLFASYEITLGCEMALTEILNLRLEKAQELLNQERLKKPDNYYVDYLENYKEVINVLVKEDKSTYEKYLDSYEERLKKLEDNETESPYSRALIAEMTAHTGLMNVINSDVIAGFVKIVKANKLLKRNFQEYPDFFLNKKLYGVFNVGIGNIPPSVKWATNFLGLTGDTDLGFKYLESYQSEIANHPALLSESLIYMMFAYQICGDDQGTYEMLKENYPLAVPTTLGTYLYANTLDRVAKTEESLKLLSELELDKDRATFFPIILLTGKGKLTRLDDNADAPYLYYLENSKNENYKKESCNKLSFHYLLHNQEDKYNYYKNEAKNFEKEVMRPDREAEVDINRTDINIDLLKASFLTNGGYFKRADSILLEFEPTQVGLSDKTLFYMLKGKILMGTGKKKAALNYFEKAIIEGNEISKHYAAESALMAGNIKFEDRNYEKAKAYYELCQNIKCDNNVYRQNIQKTAKSQLRKIKNLNEQNNLTNNY